MIIDCDTHIMPRDAFDYVDEALTHLRPILKFDESGQYAGIDFPGKPPDVAGTTPRGGVGSGGNKYKGISDLETRLADNDAMGVDVQVLLPQFSAWWHYLIEPKLAVALCRSFNRSLERIGREYQGRFIGVATVPLQDVEASIEETEWAKEHGMGAVVVDWVFPVQDHPYGTTLGEHHELWPFFQRAEELDMPILTHAVQHGHRISNLPRFRPIGLDYFGSVYVEAQMNLVSLITSGLLDDFPRLQIVHTEMNTEFIPYLVRRMDAIFKGAPTDFFDDVSPQETRAQKALITPGAGAKNQRLPSEYFKSNFFFTIEPEEPELAEAVDFLGAERFLFATDYPHDDPGGRMKFRDRDIFAVNKQISEEDKELIRSGNAVRLFKLPTH